MGKQKKQRDCEFPSIQDLLHDIAAEQVGEELAGEIAKDGFFQAAEESFIKGPLRSREELISLQEKSVQQLKETLTTSREHATMISRNTLSDLGKPFSPSTPARSMHSLLPIAVRDLTLGITHRGRSLTGRVLGEVGTMRAVMGLLEDAAGEVVRFAVYSHLADVPLGEAQRMAMQMYPSGRLISICEPYYKIATDNIAMVRVDNPMGIVFLDDHPCNSSWCSAALLKEQAAASYREGRFAEAQHGFEHALSIIESSGVTALVLQNLAAAFLRMEDPKSALFVAAAAMACLKSPLSAKACYRAATAAVQLGKPVAAMWALQQAPKAGGAMEKDVHNLKRSLQQHKKDAVAHGHIAFALAVVSAQVEAPIHLCKLPKSPAEVVLAANESPGMQAECDRHETTSEEMSLELLKAKGHACFQAGNLEGAVEQWRCALGTADPMVATLLCNQAQAALQLENFDRAALLASAAVVLAPSSEKAHFRRAKALLLAQQPFAAQEACGASLRVLRNSTSLNALMKQCAKARRGDATLAWEGLEPAKGRLDLETPPVFTDKLLKDVFNGDPAGSTSAGTLADSLNLFDMLHPDAMKDAGIGPPLTPFHKQYFAQCGVPPACDADKCSAKLSDAYNNACVNRMILPLVKSNLELATKLLDSENAAVFLTLNRGGDHVAQMISAKDGEVHFSLIRAKYHGCHARLAAFCNRPNFPLPLCRNTTHVAVGFVDLGDLAETMGLWHEEGSLNSYGPKGILHWVGIDSSAYVCAIAAVELEMLQHDCPVDHVCQVRYSAAWSTAVRESFRAAATAALLSSTAVESPEVTLILRIWTQSSVSLVAARRGWAELCQKSWTQIGTFQRQEDQHALCQYVLTGQLLDAQVGSSVMFDTPPKGEICHDPCFLQTITNAALMNECRTSKVDIVVAATKIARMRVQRLRAALKDGQLTVKVRFNP